MTYGVYQCRVCGRPISPKGPEVAEQQAKANRRPQMPEKEWRRRGYLAPPTGFQIYTDPSHGCCSSCGLKELRKFTKIGVITFWVGALFVVAVIVFAFIITYLPH